MAIGDWPIADASILESSAGTPVVETSAFTYWITLDDDIIYNVQIGSIQCERILNGKSSLSFTVLNPSPLPQAGQAVKFVILSRVIFGGYIQTVTLNSDQSESVLAYTLDCVGWEGWLDKHLVKTSYSNQNVSSLIGFVMTDANLTADGFSLGYRDDGGTTLTLTEADYVRASDYLRDIATAGGGGIEIGPEKEINFRRINFVTSPFTMTNADAESITTKEDVDDYCNSMTVRAIGVSGNTVVQTRTDTGEIAQRITVEGGNGVYEAFEEVHHPNSDDTVDLARFAISMAFMFMHSRARVNKPVQITTRRHLLDVGQLLTFDLPGMNVTGGLQISRMTVTDEEAKILYAIEATWTSRRQLNLESLLKVVRANKTRILIPLDEFQNIVEFTGTGTTVWNVPGATGNVEVEIGVYAAGGGGGGSTDYPPGTGGEITSINSGGSGGSGGKAISFRTYAVGTTLNVVRGAPGTAGALSTSGGDASPSYVSSNVESFIARGYGGTGGKSASFADWKPVYGYADTAPSGEAGGAEGDFPFVGAGQAGGTGGYGVSTYPVETENPGTTGNVAYIYIRY
jgi:hypothetical protein